MTSQRLAVLFTDMEGSTETSSARGDAAALELLRVHEMLVRKAAAAHDGRVVKSTGDGYLISFGTSFDAVAGALEIRNALADHNIDHPADPVLVRFGINIGDAIEEGGDLFGLAVNAGARIAAKASTAQVLVSDAVRADLADIPGWTMLDRGLFWLKGLREQWRLHEVTDRAPAEPAAHASTGRLPFVGRDAERATLRRYVDGANDGHGSLVFVTGAAGSGKTRLVHEIGAEVHARGLQFVTGHCYEAAGETPYAPVIEIIEAIARRLPDDIFRAVLGDGASEISRLMPDLRDRWSDIPSPADWPVQEPRSALFVALRDALARMAATRPMIVTFDDLHWADEATLRLLEYIAGELHDLPVSVFATYAEDELAANASFRPFLSSLHRRRLAESVHVPPLAKEHVGELLSSLAIGPAPVELVAQLHDATGGNPFYVEEVVGHLIDVGSLLDDRGMWRGDAAALDLDVPDSVRFTIENRLDKVSATTRSVLTTAAVIGRDFGFELLEDLAGLGEDALLDALDEAERARLVVAVTDGDVVRFTFPHGLIQRTLASEISLTRRQRVHVQIADALEHVYAGSLSDRAADIAFHLVHAGRWAEPQRATRFLLLAGDRALEAAAFEEALRHYDRVVGLLTARGDDRTRAQALEKMGLAERSLGHLDDALALWEESLAAYHAIGATDDTARLCLTAAIQVAWWRRGREVMALVDRGLEALGDEDSPLRGGLLALAGGVASQAGSYDQASRLLDDALTIAHRHRDEGVLGLALYSLAVHHFSYLQYENVVAAGRASMKHLRTAGDLWNLANVQGYVGASLGWLGRVGEAYDMGRDAEPLAKRLGNWSAYVFADGACAFRELGTQPAADVLARRGQEALRLGRELGFPWLTSIGHTRLGLSAFWEGQWEQALSHVEDAARDEPRSASGGHLGRLFLLNAYLGNREITLELIREADPEMPVVGRPNSGTSWTLALAAVEAFAMLGERDRAARLYPTVIDHAVTGALMRSWDYRLVGTLAGIAAGCAGEWDQARSHFAHARKTARTLPMRHEEPEVLRFEAAMLLSRGEPGDDEVAAALLDEAIAMYDQFGMVRHARLAREMSPLR